MMDHFFKDIPGWAAFADLYVEVVRDAPAGKPLTFVEVGSWLGRSACLMGVEIANSGKEIEFVCVDPWTDGGPDLRNTDHFKKLGVQNIYDGFLKNIEPVRKHVIPLRMTSIEASSRFADGSVDFLMLDGDHSYEAVRDDITAWLPKMKKGGIISGDDFGWPGVTKAVNEKFGAGGAVVDVVWKHRNPDYRKEASYWKVQV